MGDPAAGDPAAELLAATPVSRTWRVPHGSACAVLREDMPLARRLGLNRAAEPGVIQAAAAAGIGPALIAADPERGSLLTEWLPGRSWTPADLQVPGNAARAARLLRRLHATPLAGPRVDLADAIRRYAALAGPAAEALAADASRQLTALFREQAEPPVFCHMDPTPGNFIEDDAGFLRLIDWEYAGLCHRGFDLAILGVAAGTDGGSARDLLTAYLGREPAGEEVRRHQAWADFSRCLTRLWEEAATCTQGPS